MKSEAAATAVPAVSRLRNPLNDREIVIMLQILVDAAVLIVLLKSLSGVEVDLGIAAIIALAASFGATFVAIGLMLVIGVVGIVLAAILMAVAVGIALSLFFGADLKRACLIGVIFTVVHIGTGFGLMWMTRT